jgi:gluconokinase
LRQLRLPDKKGDLEELLRASSGRNSRLTILPFLLSERAPTWPEDLCGAVTGLNQSTTAADLLVTMVRASFNRLAAIMEDLEAAAGRTQKIIVSGGIVQSPASLQMLADSLGRRLEISAEQEASLRGAAVFALEKLGYTVPAPKIKRRVHHRPRQTKQRREEAAQERELERWLNRLSSEKAPARNVRIR